MKALTPALVLLTACACSGEPSDSQLRPPREWRRTLEAAATSLGTAANRLARDAAERAKSTSVAADPQTAGPVLAAAIRFSRTQALNAGPTAIPANVRQALSPYFPQALLNQVRWTTAGHRLSLGTVLAGWYYEEGAVTLHDVVVFSDRKLADNVWLWAHELAHVQQYQQLGVAGFADRYVRDWRAIETAATRVANEITVEIKASRLSGTSENSAPSGGHLRGPP